VTEHEIAVRPGVNFRGWQMFCSKCHATVVGPTERSVRAFWKRELGGTGCPPPQMVLDAIAHGGLGP
jgi:hypothetical protein